MNSMNCGSNTGSIDYMVIQGCCCLTVQHKTNASQNSTSSKQYITRQYHHKTAQLHDDSANKITKQYQQQNKTVAKRFCSKQYSCRVCPFGDGRIEQAEHDIKTGQTDLDRQNKMCITKQAEDDSQNRTDRTGQAG